MKTFNCYANNKNQLKLITPKAHFIKMLKSFLLLLVLFVLTDSENGYSQAGCGPTVPSYNVNFIGTPGGSFSTPSVSRVGNCCSTTSPDNCIHFSIVLDTQTVAVKFEIVSGAIPTGALFYQINCGLSAQVGQQICLSAPGPYDLTFCKPGNNTNVYKVTSITRPIFPKDDSVRIACSKVIQMIGTTTASTTWNSIYPGASGAYNSYLSCSTGCTNPTFTPAAGSPPYIDYVICGSPIASGCGLAATVCDTVRLYAYTLLQVSVSPNPATYCPSASGATLTANPSGGLPPYNYTWKNSGGTVIGSSSTYFASSTGTYTVETKDALITCPKAITIIPVSISNVILTPSSTNVNCFGGNNGTASVTVSGGTAPYSYNWSNGATTQSLTGLIANGYTVTVTDAGGCTKNATVVINQPSAALNSSVSASNNISCYGGNNGSISLSVSGGITPYIYHWSNGAITQNLSNATAGTYSVTITDGNGCTSTITSVTISQPAGALAGITSSTSNVSCFGGNNGAINLSVTGGTPPYYYNWSNGATVQDLTNIYSGTYSVTVTDAHGCTDVTSGISITQPASALSASTISTNNVSCFGGTNGSISLIVTGGTTPYSYNWNNGATTQNLTSLSSGSYSVTITDVNGCTATQSQNISQPSASLSATSSANQNVSCYGGTNGSIALSVNGGTTPYTYNWNNGATSQNISNIASGTYTVTITDANGCTANQSQNISQPSASLSATASASQNVSCFGGVNGSITMSVNGGTTPYIYSWNNGATTQSISNLASGTYNVTVTDANGCTANQTQNITQPSVSLSASSSVNSQVSCFGGANGSINLTVIGGTAPYSYNWSNGANTQDINGLSSGIYNVTIIDANGCSVNNSATVTQPSGTLSANATTLQNVSCNSGSNGSIAVSVTGGTTPYTYDWSNGASTQNISGLTSGTFIITITDANGCTTTQNGIVTQPTSALSATSSANQNVSCYGGVNGAITLTVNGGTVPYSYNWSNGTNTQNLSNLTSGTYTVSVTDANGCIANQSQVVTQPTIGLSAAANISQNVSCNGGNNAAINITVNGGTSPYTFNWSNGAVTQNVNNLIVGTYTVTVTDAHTCTEIQTVTITQPAAGLSASSTVTGNISCFSGNNGSIDLTVNGGTAPYNYSWNTGTTTEDLNGLSAGNYSVTVTDANGCTAIDNATITQPAGSLSTSISLTQGVLCNGGNNGSINITATGGTTPYIYNWSNGATTQNVSNLSAGTYTATITDANGCFAGVTGTIAQPSASLSATASVTQNVNCYAGTNGAINLTVNGGTSPYSYNWSNAATTQNINNISSGTYTVSITDANGCTQTANGTVTQPTGSLAATASVTQNVNCYAGANGTIDVTANGGTTPYNYDWSNGATTQDLNNLLAGTYVVSITDANGCTSTQNGTVTQPSASLSATASTTQNVSCFAGANGSINLTVSGGTIPYTYNWTNGATTQNISNLSSGTYTVSITDANGCTSSEIGTISQPTGALSSGTTVTGNISCFSGNNGSIDLSVSGGTVPYNYNWNTGATTEDLINLSAGTYSVNITDANGCTSNSSATITQPAGSLSINVAINQQVSCYAGANGSINLTANGGTNPYTFSWSNGSTLEDISNLPAGSYTVTMTDANGCNASASATITQPSGALNASASISQNVSCYSGANGSIDLTTTNGTMPYSYTWNNGATTEDITGVSSGTYTVTVTDANFCTTITSAIITQPSGALNAILNVSQNVNCNAGTNGSIDLTTTNGTSPYIYNWSNGATTEDINNLSAGTYDVTVSDANGCTTIQSGTITQPSTGLSASATANQNVSCYGGVNGAITLIVSGGTPSYSYNWSNGATTQNVSNLTSGTYTVSIIDANGCTANQSQVVTQPTVGLSAAANVSQNVSCNGGDNAAISLTVNGGTAPYTFNWSNGAATQNVNNLTAGTYTVTVTDANACTEIQIVTITQPSSGLSASSTVTGNISCFSGNNGSVDLTVNGGTSPYIYSWNTGETTEDLSGLSAGNYSVTVTDANGCTTIDNATITQPAGSLSTSISLTQGVLCNGGNNGSINLMVAGGTTPYIYNWSNGATTQDISNLSAGIYTATITDANGCFAGVTGTITQPSASLSATASVTQNVNCYSGANGAINLTVNGGTSPYSYNWSNAATTQNISNLNAGTYSVSITDANQCTFTQNATVTQPTGSLSATVSATQNVSCYGGSNGIINLTVIGGTSPYTFNWSNGSITEDINALSAGTYVVSITDLNGCTTTQNGTITQPLGALTVNISASQNVSCYGGANGTINLTVNGGTTPYSFIWSNGASTQNIINLSAGIYTVSITDANGCISSQSGIISQPSGGLSAAINVTQNVLCYSGVNGAIAVSVNGGTLPYIYNWSNGATTQNISNLASGTYSVTITDANGCTSNQTQTVSQPSASLSATASASQNVSCFGGANGTVTLSVNGGTSPYSFNWSTGATTQNVSNLTTGIYTATVTDANGCNSIANATVTQPTASLNANANITQNVSCNAGTNGAINLTVTSGTAPYSYNWSNGTTTEDISNLSSGTFTVTVTDANGCTTTISTTITQPSSSLSASSNVLQNVSCFSGANGSINLTINGGTSPYSFNWNNGAVTQNISGLSSGNYSVTITDANGCTATSSATISQPTSSLNANASVTQNVNCHSGTNGSINLTVSGGTSPYTFNWSNAATTEDLNSLSAGTYTVSITDANGCTQTASATVTQPSNSLNATASVSQTVSCFGGNNGVVTLIVSGGTSPYTYSWGNGATTQNLTNVSQGTYTVIIADANGCSRTVSATVTQPSNTINASANVSQTVSCFGGNNGAVTLLVSGGTSPYSYSWNNGATTQNLTNVSHGTYTATITDANGCSQTASATVTQPTNTINANASVSHTVSCFGGNNGAVSLVVSGGTSPYSYSWSNGVTTQNLTNVSQGTYTAIITDANGCSQTTSATVTQPANTINASASVSQTVSCFGGSNGSVTLNVSGGSTPYTYSWSNGATTQNITNVSQGTYTATITDANGCSQIASATVTQPSTGMSVSGSGSTSNCLIGIPGNITISVIGGTSPFTYLWNTGNTSQNLNNQGAGTYSVTITDANQCTTNGSFVITDQSVFHANASGPPDICIGELAKLVADSVPNATYQWYASGQLLVGSTTNVYITPAAGSYTVTVSNSCGTFTSDSIVIKVHTVDNISLSPNVIICPGESTQLNATGGVSYEWTPTEGLTFTNIPNPVASPSVTTQYTVTITNDFGCKTTGEIQVGVLCDSLIIPSGFSPNDDVINDAFVIKGIDRYPGNKIWIYNRWGNLVYKAHDYDNRWDGVANVSGMYIGKKVPAGTYFYVLELNTNTKPLQGYIVMKY